MNITATNHGAMVDYVDFVDILVSGGWEGPSASWRFPVTLYFEPFGNKLIYFNIGIN